MTAGDGPYRIGQRGRLAHLAQIGPTSAELRGRVLAQLEQDGEPLYYVCGLCGHYFCTPEQPTQCESCRRPMPICVPLSTEADAATFSHAVLEYLRGTS